jgi:L-asparaginase / beta-aspartyl-peptidase
VTYSHKPLPTLVASENGRDGMLVAMELLRKGKTALDAVEIACRITEDDPDEHSVGYSGLPNVLGEVELDASIMDGRTLRAGGVAAVQDYGHVITLARQVMEETAHVLIVGKGAQRFAAEMGHTQADQRTDEAQRRWRTRFEEMGLQLSDRTELRRLAIQLTRPLNLDNAYERSRLRDDALEGEHALKGNGKEDRFGTVNYLALDQQGDLASAVSTSGLAWKYPGRVGDSPIIGAGNYCDNRYGAAACTGMGELAIRASTARSLVLYLKMGMSLQEAGLETLRDLRDLNALPGQYMNIVALSPNGEHAGFTTVPSKKYLYLRADMDEPMLMDRILLS